MSKDANTHEPLLIGGQKAPAWVFPLLIVCLAPIFLFVFGPQPLPKWFLAIGVICTIGPLIALGCYLVYIGHRDLKNRSSLLDGLEFDAVDKGEWDEIELRLVHHMENKTIPRTAKLKNAWRGTVNGITTEFLDFRYMAGRTKGKLSLVSVKVLSPAQPVMLKRFAPPFIRHFYANKLSISNPSITKRWLIFGDLESAEHLLNNDVCEIICDFPKFPWFICIWDEDRLYLGFTGHPSRSGLEFLIEKAHRVAHAAHILPG